MSSMANANQASVITELETLSDILQNQITPNCKALFSMGKLPTVLDCRLLIGRITARILDPVNCIICVNSQQSILRTEIRNAAYSLIDLLEKRAREAEEEEVAALRQDAKDANGLWMDELHQKFEQELKPQLDLLKKKFHDEILEPLLIVDKSLLSDRDLLRCYDMHAEAYKLVHGDDHEGMI